MIGVNVKEERDTINMDETFLYSSMSYEVVMLPLEVGNSPTTELVKLLITYWQYISIKRYVVGL